MNRSFTLATAVDEARNLDKLRQRIVSLQKKGLQGLSAPYAPRERWHSPGDNVEKALLTRLLYRYLPQTTHFNAIAAQLEENRAFDPASPLDRMNDNVPVLRAALVLSALVWKADAAISNGAQAALHRIFAEISQRSGGAGAGGQGSPVTAFVTWKCVVALTQYAALVENTARLCKEIAASVARLDPSVPAPWQEIEIERLKEAMRLSVAAQTPNLFGDTALFNPGDNATVQKVKDTLLPRLRRLAEMWPGGPAALVEAATKLNALSSTTSWMDIGQALEQLAAGLREAIEGPRAFLRSVLNDELAAAIIAPDRIPDAAELLFSAAGLAISGAEASVSALAITKVSALISDNGRLPSHKPFDVLTKGYVLHVSGAEIIIAFAELGQSLEGEMSHDVLVKLFRYLLETWDESGQGWLHERDPGKCQWWCSALAIEALDLLRSTCDRAINALILRQFSVREPHDFKVGLGDAFYPDYGLQSFGVKEKSRALWKTLLDMEAHVRGIAPANRDCFSLILHGPAGTGKTTLVEAVAKSAGARMVEITPSDILLAGTEQIETRARLVFEALSLLTNVVIIFDEFDSVLKSRTPDVPIDSIFPFLTPGMLPKLKRLHDSAERQRTAYVLCTNLLSQLDAAVVREGRFDLKIGVFPPDALSRSGRFRQQLFLAGIQAPDEARVAAVVRGAAGGGMTRLAKPGWFTKGPQGPGTPLGYVKGGEEPVWPAAEAQLAETHNLTAEEKEEWGFVDRLDAEYAKNAGEPWQELKAANPRPAK